MTHKTRSRPATDLLTKSTWKIILYTLLVAVIAFIFLYRLDVYPTPWHDEGEFLHVARNFAFEGIYAQSSSEGYRFTGPVISTGPTVILPVAALFRVFGASFSVARLMIVAYAGLAVYAFYQLAFHVQNKYRIAFVATILLIFSDSLDLPFYARNVVGEVPGLAFLMAGLVVWLRSDRQQLKRLTAAGVLLGLACITKNQFAIIILPAMLLSWLLDLGWYRRRGWRYFVIPGAIAGLIYFAWTYYVLYLLGADSRDVARDLQNLRIASSNAYFLFDLELNVSNLIYLMSGESYSGLFIPALLMGLFLACRRTDEGQRWGMLCTFLLMGTALYVFSVGWPRGTVVPLALAAIFVARLLYSLTNGYRPDLQSLKAYLHGRSQNLPVTACMNFIVMGLLFGSVMLPFAHRIYNTLYRGSADAYRTADYLMNHVPESALIETWESELAVLTDHPYHYPPQVVEAYRLEETLGRGTLTRNRYDFRDFVDPDYLINGPFSRPIKIYDEERLQNFELIATFGEYAVYQKLTQQ